MSSVLELTPLHVSLKPILFDLSTDYVFEQKFTPKWTIEDSYGKMDGIPFYSNTTRQIEVQFELNGGGDEKTIRRINDQVDRLVKLQYPKFQSVGASTQKTFAGAPFFKMQIKHVYGAGSKVGVYPAFPEVSGYIESLSIQPGIKKGINIFVDSKNRSALQAYYSVQFTFHVIHSTLPGWTNQTFNTDGNGFFVRYDGPFLGGGQGARLTGDEVTNDDALGGRYRDQEAQTSLAAARESQRQQTEIEEMNILGANGDPFRDDNASDLALVGAPIGVVQDPTSAEAGEISIPGKTTEENK